MAVDAGKLRVAVAGLGAVGWPVSVWWDANDVGLALSAVSVRHPERARKRIAKLSNSVPIIPLSELHEHADVIVEALPPHAFGDIAFPVVRASKTLIVLTSSQLIQNLELVDMAYESGGKIIVPSGALLGLDAIRAAAIDRSTAVVMRTQKPPTSLQSAKFIQDQRIDVFGITEAKCLYRGSVREAAQRFPANVNVAVALALAGVGLDSTSYELWCDPAIDRNIHEVEVNSECAHFTMHISNVPTEENPATGKLTSLSVIATLIGLTNVLHVGT